MSDIYDKVAETNYSGVDWESEWNRIGYSFVEECAEKICEYYNLTFERIK